MDGAVSLVSLEEGILRKILVVGVTSTSRLQALSSIGIGSVLMFLAGITACPAQTASSGPVFVFLSM